MSEQETQDPVDPDAAGYVGLARLQEAETAERCAEAERRRPTWADED